MLSIVICSVNEALLAQVKQSIDSTVGVPYELIVRDNRQSAKGLCEMYNDMAARAIFPYVCFMHEDILFETNDWGKLLINVLEQNKEIGLIGVAGAKYKARTFSGWYCGHPALDCYNIIHRANGRDHKMFHPSDNDGALHEVICIDGVFMFCRKSVWESTRFDDQLLKGFHYYDIDFSLRAAKLCKVVVTMSITIIHITLGGDYGNKWVQETIHYHDAKSNTLPHFITGTDTTDIEDHITLTWLDALKKKPISLRLKKQWINRQQLYRKPKYWYGIFKFLLYRPLGLKRIHHFFKADR